MGKLNYINVQLDNCVVNVQHLNNNANNDRHIRHKTNGQVRHLSNAEISIACRNLRYEVKQYGGLVGNKKPILRRLNGYFKCNSLNGLLGPSGAGKTTFLNALSGKDRSGLSKDSEIYMHAQAQSTVSSCFIEQHVHQSIVPRMTVKDILRYAFKFKNGDSHTNQEMSGHIREVVHELMLDQNVLEQNFVDCSGGEQKRIAIAQELMSLCKPQFMFIDEPTTGLDSCAAFQVINCLKKLTEKYRITVIASIHLPNQETLNLFDKLYVLAKGGVTIYSGPPNGIQPFLEKEIQLKVPDQQPPVEALMRVACHGIQDPSVAKLANKCLSTEYQHISSHMSHLTYQPSGIPNFRKPFSISDLFLMIVRFFQIIFISNVKHFTFNVCQYILLFVILSTLYNDEMAVPRACYALDQENSTLTCSRDLYDNRLVGENNTFHGYTMLLIGFLVMCTSAILFSPIVKVFRNEHRNHWYSLGVFYWSANIVSFIEVTFYSLLISTLAYFLSYQQAADDYVLNWTRFGYYLFFIWLLCVYCQSIGHLIGAILMDYIEVAIILCQVIYILMAIMNGYFVDTEKTGNVLFIELANVIAMKFITKGLMYTFYGVDRCEAEKEFSSVLLKYHVDENQIREYVLRVVVNVLIVRTITFVYMYYKFNTFMDHPVVKLLAKLFKKSPTFEIHPMMAIDYAHAHKNCAVQLEGNKQYCSLERVKEENEIKFEHFSRNKIIIAWKDLNLYGSSSIYENGSHEYEKSDTKRPKEILRNLNGQFCFGTLNALMGTSGAGKTSLLRVLNGQCKTRVSDSTRFYLSRFTKIETCFITQEVSGHLMPGLTAKQFLVYASRLKNLNSNVDHEKVALSVLDKLDLMDTGDTKLDRCSGGERKRLALAAELTATVMPNLVCIDEPTSGLDSNSAETVISCLKKLTQTDNLAILASIHQPNTSILSMFDQLYVLARGGVCIYSGPHNQIESHLKQIPEIQRQLNSQFAIELLVKHSCSDHQDPIVQKLIQQNNQQFGQIKQLRQVKEETQLVPDGVVKNRHRFSLQSVYILCLRYSAYIRGYLWHHLVAFVTMSFMYGYILTIFFDPAIAIPAGCMDIDSDFNNTCIRTAEAILEEYQLTENYKFNYFMLVVFLFLLMLQSSLIFGKEFVQFVNEHRNGWYSSGSFYLMKSLFEIIPLPFIIMVYVYICNIYDDVIPGIYWNLVFVLTLSAIGFQGMAHIFSLLSNGNITILTIISISVFILFCQISNFFIHLGQLHYIYQFMSNFSISRFVFESALLLQYGFGRCDPKQLQPILYSMSIDDAHYYECIEMLLFNLLLYRVIAIYLLIGKSNPVQNRRQRVARIKQYQSSMEPCHSIIAGLDATDQRLSIKQIAL